MACSECAGFGGKKLRFDSTDDFPRDVVLHGEDVHHLPVVAFRQMWFPDTPSISCAVMRMTVATLTYAPLEHVADAELACHLTYVR